MSRVDHVVKRRMESARKMRRREDIAQVNGFRIRSGPGWTKPVHKQGDQWWRNAFAEAVERRDGRAKAKPPVPSRVFTRDQVSAVVDHIRSTPRPDGLTRQAKRALDRRAVKIARRQMPVVGA